MKKFWVKIRPAFCKYHEEEYDMIFGSIIPARWLPRVWVLAVWTLLGFYALFSLKHLP